MENGDPAPPVDMRYLMKPLVKLNAESSRAQIVSFLENLYNSVAETLPDVKDGALDGDEFTLTTPADQREDQYRDALTKDDLVTVTAPQRGKKRIRSKIKSVAITDGRHPSQSGLEIRFLPPGHIKDYFDQLRASDDEHNVSFSYFWKATFSWQL